MIQPYLPSAEVFENTAIVQKSHAPSNELTASEGQEVEEVMVVATAMNSIEKYDTSTTAVQKN